MTKKELLESCAFQSMDDNTEIVVFIDGNLRKFYPVIGVTDENGFFDNNFERQSDPNLVYLELIALKLDADTHESIYKDVRDKKIEEELHKTEYESPILKDEHILVYSEGIQEKLEDLIYKLPDELKKDSNSLIASAIAFHIYDVLYYGKNHTNFLSIYKESIDSFCKELTNISHLIVKDDIVKSDIKHKHKIKIKKYRPNFCSGFEDEYFEVNSVEELLKSELCEYEVENGYEVCFDFREHKDERYQSYLMAVKEKPDSERGCEWWVIALIHNYNDAKTLKEWLPDFNAVLEKYKKG